MRAGSSQQATEGNGETGRGEVTTRVTTGDRVADELIDKTSRVLLKHEAEARATGGRPLSSRNLGSLLPVRPAGPYCRFGFSGRSLSLLRNGLRGRLLRDEASG
jgi:hypothetical protein